MINLAISTKILSNFLPFIKTGMQISVDKVWSKMEKLIPKDNPGDPEMKKIAINITIILLTNMCKNPEYITKYIKMAKLWKLRLDQEWLHLHFIKLTKKDRDKDKDKELKHKKS